MFVVGLVLTTAGGRASAAEAPLTGAATAGPTPAVGSLEADGVAFGMDAEGVARLYDRWWDKHFIPKYQKTNPGPKTRELDFQLAENKKALRRLAQFDGRTTSFDKSDFREEFAHGSGETMTSVKLVRRPGDGGTKPVSYTRRFFFFQNRLWKIYDEYRLDAHGPFGADFKEAAGRVEASLGKGVKRTRGPESQFETVVLEQGKSRVRLVKLPSNRVAVVRSDEALAKEVLDRRAQLVNTTEQPLDEDIQAVIR
jgi:hypothetical protein